MNIPILASLNSRSKEHSTRLSVSSLMALYLALTREASNIKDGHRTYFIVSHTHTSPDSIATMIVMGNIFYVSGHRKHVISSSEYSQMGYRYVICMIYTYSHAWIILQCSLMCITIIVIILIIIIIIIDYARSVKDCFFCNHCIR